MLFDPAGFHRLFAAAKAVEGVAGLSVFYALCITFADETRQEINRRLGVGNVAPFKGRIEPRMLTPKEAAEKHPVSVRFIYDRGEELGFARRVDGTRKVVVDEAALLRVLEPKG